MRLMSQHMRSRPAGGVQVEWLGRIGYSEALALQETALAEVAAGGAERLFLLEHDPVYTIGRTRDQSSLRDVGRLPYPVVETNRGGQATFHGPGQLVGYPILDLSARGRDLHLYLRFLEDVLIEVCAAFGVLASRSEGLTGVWTEDRKIASLGVGLRKWVTMHGFALNVCNSLEEFSMITPCGIAGVEMTSLQSESGKPLSVTDVAEVTRPVFLSRIS